MAYHFYFLKPLSHVVNFENFQPTFDFSCWEWVFTGRGVRVSICPCALISVDYALRISPSLKNGSTSGI